MVGLGTSCRDWGHMRLTWWLFVVLGCTDGTDTVTELEQQCAGEVGEPTAWLGTGAGGLFEELPLDAEVGLDVAPQGGFGVTVQVQTQGLRTDAPATVQLDTEIGGANSGSFTNEALFLFCRDDGRGTLGAGVAVGFDPDLYTSDNLDTLDGEVTDLVVRVTDERGVSATTRQTVTITLGGNP